MGGWEGIKSQQRKSAKLARNVLLTSSKIQVDKFRMNFNNLIAHNMLTNYLNLIKESIQKQLLTSVL